MAEVFYPRQEDYIFQLNKLADSATVQQSYYGPYATPPTTRPDGTPRRVGDRYFNTTTNAEMTWNGTAWFAPNLSAAQLASATGATYVGYTAPSGTVTTVDSKLKQIDSVVNPQVQNKKIVVLGSSVALGQGSPSFNGWARRLATALTPYGYTVVNKAISGNKTNDCIGRFYTDVVTENPGIVILGLSLANEGLIGGQKEVVYSQYIKNMLRLVAMCREMGYKVVVTGVYSNNDYTAEDYSYLIQADQELENSDIPYINFLGAVDDGTGHWRAGMFENAGHPNDVGHESLFRAFPLSLFDNLSKGNNVTPVAVNPNVMKIASMTTTEVPVVYTSESQFGSFTVMARIRRVTGTNGKPLIALESTAGTYEAFRIRNTIDALVVSNGTTDIITSTVLTSTGEELCMILSFDYYTNTWKFWIDGAFIGSSVYAPAQTVSYDQIAFGGRTNFAGFDVNGYEYRDMAVWRTALTAEQVAEATAGRVNKASLNMYSPVVDVLVPKGSRLINLAPSSTSGRVAATGINTYLYNQVTSSAKALSVVKTRANGLINTAMLDPAVPVINRSLRIPAIDGDSSALTYFAGAAANGTVAATVDVEAARLGIGGQSGINFAGFMQMLLSAGNGSATKEGYRFTLKARDISSGVFTNSLFSVSGTGLVYVPLLKAGSTDTGARHSISFGAAQGDEVLHIGRNGATNPSVAVLAADGLGGWNGASSVLFVGKNSVTGRSVSSAGTVNTGGNDYAEYIYKVVGCGYIEPGAIIGLTSTNEITNKWDDAIMFAIKSTAPSFVGGDTWAEDVGPAPVAQAGIEPAKPMRIFDEMGEQEFDSLVVIKPGDTDEEWEAKMADYEAAVTEWEQAVESDSRATEEFEDKLEVARSRVDRIAIAGRVPVNIYGVSPGDYIIPVQDGEGIKGVSVSEDDMTLKQYLRAIGQVITIEEDGRAYVMVKSV